jgi:hypothetical protein
LLTQDKGEEHMTDKEAMKQALDALETEVSIDWTNDDEFNASAEKMHEAIAALKERLAQPEQEPVAHLWECLGRWSAYLVNNGTQAECAPPSWLVEAVKNATTPPQRKPLTDEQIYDMYNEPRSDAEMIAFARAIEAAHGIKENT